MRRPDSFYTVQNGGLGQVKKIEPGVAYTRFNFGDYEVVDHDTGLDPGFDLCDETCEEFEVSERGIPHLLTFDFRQKRQIDGNDF